MTVPGIVKAAVALTFLNSWVLFEEFIVDRHGLWEYMPFYRVARFCSWDVAAVAVIGLVSVRAFRKRSE